ncbi:Serine phosphatase RsbU subunit sigma [Ignavibacterium album JCM 16511]|uniref:Serine phosphatase RsbU subunit sigma n=1 Tax=Ignavibacterium album (strain DSM 19864 / JCM 16511 / NBRC 101810 / Mat9-16) TaxID=945713 RepID=I0AHT6_IGNAJ|nr:SpoIIE family protein phosphatase [Ignavibacterium album]AFH48543.1 Serine phosphatase RsbU subunit sigma [Ignavibacterium album JCM 16511]
MHKLKTFFSRNRVRLVGLLTIFLLFLEVINIYVSFNINVTSNDECLWVGKRINQDSVAYYFTKVKVNGVSWDAGIRDGDQLISINNYKVLSDQQAQIVLNTVKSGDYADYVVKKPDGTIFNTKVKIKKLLNFGALTFNISALIWLLIGFLVYSIKPDGRQQKLFYLLSITFVLTTFFNFFPQNISLFEIVRTYPVGSLIVYILASLGSAALPFIFLYFIWNFFRPIEFAQEKWVKALFIILPSLLFLYPMSLMVKFWSLDPRILMDFRKYQNLTVIVNSITNIIAGITLFVLFFREKDKQKRKPILLIIFSFVFAFAVQIYLSTIAPALADTIFNSPEYYFPVILLILVPMIYAYAIFKYHLLDVSEVVKNTIFYSVATASVVAIYFLSIYGLGQSLSSLIGFGNEGIVAIVLFMIFAIRFQSTKDKALKFITQKFYPEQFAFENVLIKFSNEISTVVGKENILNLTLNTFVGSLKLKKFAILLNDEKSDSLNLVRHHGFNHINCQLNRKTIQDYYFTSLELKEYPELSRENFSKLFGEKSETLIEEGIFTIVPLIVKSKVIGALLFGLKHSGLQFSGKDIELLYAAANQLAIAIENARLYQSEVEKQKIEHDLELARNIQKGLLPSCVSNLNGLDICGVMIPAMQVGGDYYDLIPVNENKIFVAVGDVSGKGLSASLYMAKLQTIIQLYCREESTPREILIEANKLLFSSFEPGSFITLTLALFDREKMKVKLSRAGHLPVLIHDDKGTRLLKTKGIALGLDNGYLFDKHLEEAEINLKGGQVFSFFSDGVTETMNEKDELFGEERLLKIFAENYHQQSTLIMEEVEKEILDFRGKAEQHDDMTVVIVKVIN